MGVSLPVYTYIAVDGYQMYPGIKTDPGIHHQFSPGLHLVAGVNGLGKSTLLLLLYHGLVGPAAIRNDDFGVPLPEVVRRDFDRFRRRVADGAKSASVEIRFQVGARLFEATRALQDLSLTGWKLDGAEQLADQDTYADAIVQSMNVGSFADVLTVLNLIVFMFESRALLMWSPLAQRNALRALFMTPSEANDLANKAQVVATTNSAYRNLLYIVNKDRKQLAKDRAALIGADAMTSEFATLQSAVAAFDENIQTLIEDRRHAEQTRLEARAALEGAKFNYDDILREIEALKLARIAGAFPSADESAKYVLARLIGDHECLACGAENGPLIDKWTSAISDGYCVLCGSPPAQQENVVPPGVVDAARLSKAEARLASARDTLATSSEDAAAAVLAYEGIRAESDEVAKKRAEAQARISQIAGVLLPSAPAVKALEDRIDRQADTLRQLEADQDVAEFEFSQVFDRFRTSIERKADAIRERFAARISEFLVEKAEITLTTVRSPIGESGQSYDWPTFQLSMTSGTFDAPAPRRTRAEVSMSQGEFIDLAFRLALVEVAAEAGPAAMIFDAPEASLDALFMRRAGAFLAQFTKDNSENRLIVTSNLTNADMIPALFGAYVPEDGDPVPQTIPREERRSRVIDLLEYAAPTSAVLLVKDRYKNLLDHALFPPAGQGRPGL